MATRRAQSLAVGIVHMQGPIAQHCVSTLHGLHVMAARRGQHCGDAVEREYDLQHEGEAIVKQVQRAVCGHRVSRGQHCGDVRCRAGAHVRRGTSAP